MHSKLPDIFMYLFLSIGPLGIGHSLSRKHIKYPKLSVLCQTYSFKTDYPENIPLAPIPPKKKKRTDTGNEAKKGGYMACI